MFDDTLTLKDGIVLRKTGDALERTIRSVKRLSTIGGVEYAFDEQLSIQQLEAKDGLRTTFRFQRKATPTVDTTARVRSSAASITLVTQPEEVAVPRTPGDMDAAYAADLSPLDAVSGLLNAIGSIGSGSAPDTTGLQTSVDAYADIETTLSRAINGEE